MAENVTTVPSKPEITLEQLKTDAVKNLLYLIHGLGRDRDKTLDLEVLRQWISETMASIKIRSDLTIDPYGIKLDSHDIEYPHYNFHLKGGELKVSRVFDDDSGSFIVVSAEDGIYNKVGGTQLSPEFILSLSNELRTNKKFVVTSGEKTLTMDTTKLELDVLQGNSHSLIGIYFNVIAGRLEATDFAVEQLSEKTEGEGIAVSGALNCDDVNVAPGSTLTVGTGGDATIINGGNVGATGVITANKVHTATYRVNGIISASSAYSLAQEEHGGGNNPEYGDIVFIRNTDSANIKITIENTVSNGSGRIKSVNLSPDCCVGFICTAVAASSTKSAWAPMSNMQVTTENVGQ